MKPESREKWLKEIDAEITRRKATIEQTQHARNSADSAMTSRHDTQREIFNTDLNLNLDALDANLRFKEELQNAGETTSVEPGAVVDVEFGQDDTETILFMNNYASLPDIQVVTLKSPLGQAIKGLKPGDQGSYSLKDRNITVTVKSVE